MNFAACGCATIVRNDVVTVQISRATEKSFHAVVMECSGDK